MSQVSKPRELAIPVIVLGEYRFGIAQSRKKIEYEVLKRVGTPIPANDAWIAALWLQYDEPILSQDSHFDFVPGVRRVSWKSMSP